jgi:hypothetical protein
VSFFENLSQSGLCKLVYPEKSIMDFMTRKIIGVSFITSVRGKD